MIKSISNLVATAIPAACALALFSPALAASAPSLFVVAPSGHHAPAALGNEKIISTVFHNDDSGVSIAAGTFVAIDSDVVNCPKTAGTCTIVIKVNAEMAGSAGTNQWAVCPTVDSTYADGCPWQGETPADGFWTTGYELQTMSVTPGKHTLGFQLYSAT
ncbi:MAG TPA: hypothetical protein VMB71_11940, partial [Acetobacteraceae bacterium]|nr:hypothetical protein [Acetobacteraceae bacterium]